VGNDEAGRQRTPNALRGPDAVGVAKRLECVRFTAALREGGERWTKSAAGSPRTPNAPRLVTAGSAARRRGAAKPLTSALPRGASDLW
jgi:hypothetical protein